MKITFWVIIAVLVGISSPAFAFKLTPEGSFIERKLADRKQGWFERFSAASALKGVNILGESVHEEITNRILDCEGDADICGSPEYAPENAYVLSGVRWNDDPPFRYERGHGNFKGCVPDNTIRLVTFPICWANVFKHGEQQASKQTDFAAAPLLIRSHFGDMQFLHAMASRENEPAIVTRDNILMWSEFTWRVGRGEYPLSTLVKDVPIKGMKELFGSKGWSIQDLFSLGNPHIRKPENMAQVAFGSLLHVLEDSFAEGHVERATPNGQTCPGAATKAPGQIIEFHSYGKQDSAKHAIDDSRYAFSAHWTDAKPNVIHVGQELYSQFRQKSSWEEAKPYIECVFALDIQARPSTSGDRYLKN